MGTHARDIEFAGIAIKEKEMEKTATITQISNDVKEWPNPKGGIVYYRDIKLSNGDVGNIGKKSRDALNIGDELTYTMDRDSKIKQVYNPQEPPQQAQSNVEASQHEQSNYQSQVSKNAAFALAYSKDLAVAMIASGTPIDAEQIIGTAEKFLKWMDNPGETATGR